MFGCITRIQLLDDLRLPLPDSIVADLFPVVKVVLAFRHNLPLFRRHVRTVSQKLGTLRRVVTRDAKEVGEFVALDLPPTLFKTCSSPSTALPAKYSSRASI
jgi:hypothetical protein